MTAQPILGFRDDNDTWAEIERGEPQEPTLQCRYVLYRDGDVVADRWEPATWPPSLDELRRWAEVQLEQYAVAEHPTLVIPERSTT